jgi:hypothetical protein
MGCRPPELPVLPPVEPVAPEEPVEPVEPALEVPEVEVVVELLVLAGTPLFGQLHSVSDQQS